MTIDARNIDSIKVVDTKTIAASGSYTSAAVDLRYYARLGIFTLHYLITGTGTAKFEYLLLNDANGSYVEPSGASDIATGKTAGNDIISFTPVIGRSMKIKVTETGGANSVIVTAYLNIQ